MRRFGSIFAALAAATALVFWLAGCGGGPYAAGEAIPEGSSALGVRQVLEDPGAYSGEVLVVEGYFGSSSCASCFVIKEGTASLQVEVTRDVSVPPRSQLNKKLQVMGELEVREEGTEQYVYLLARVLEFE